MSVVARLRSVPFADGSIAHVDLVRSDLPAPPDTVFAAMVLLRDAVGRYAVVYSPRRAEWSSPGGRREDGESVAGTALREVREETGIELDSAALRAWGYERFEPVSATGRWPRLGGCLQVFQAEIDTAAPELVMGEDDVTAVRWVTPAEFESLCGDRFWWPLVAAALLA